jgi:hypothetical protein
MIAGTLAALSTIILDAVYQHKAIVAAPLSESQYAELHLPASFPFMQTREQFAIPGKIPAVPLPRKQQAQTKPIPPLLAARNGTRDAILEMQKQRRLNSLKAANGHLEPARQRFPLARRALAN